MRHEEVAPASALHNRRKSIEPPHLDVAPGEGKLLYSNAAAAFYKYSDSNTGPCYARFRSVTSCLQGEKVTESLLAAMPPKR